MSWIIGQCTDKYLTSVIEMNDPKPNTMLFPYKYVISKTRKFYLTGSQKKEMLKNIYRDEKENQNPTN